MNNTDAWKLVLERYWHDPVGFVRDIFGVEPDEWQVELLEAVADPDERQISVRSGHGVGKSTGVSWAAIWHATCRFPQRTVITAPSASQLHDALAAELKSWIARSPGWLQDSFDVKKDRIDFIPSPSESYISFRTSREENPEALAGVHSDYNLILADEASGIPDSIFAPARSGMTGKNATMVLTGNPVRTTGLFFRTHHDLKEYWRTIHVSCLDSPRITPQFIEEAKLEYGEDSNAYRVRVLGEFPIADDDTIIPYYLVQESIGREIVPDDNIVWGLDPARFGDDASRLVKRHGNVIPSPGMKWKNIDLMKLCTAVKAEYDLAEWHEKPKVIMVDVIGIGAGVVDRLGQLGLPVMGVNVSSPPTTPGVYMNLKTELLYKVRKWLESRKASLPDDPEMVKHFTSVRYEFTDRGLIKAENKKKMKKRVGFSPDTLDATALTFAVEYGILSGNWGDNDWNKPIERDI